MDPLTHAVLGAAIVQVCYSKRAGFKLLTLAAALTAMAPDLDIFLNSASDPLFGLTMHRHFTHALIFVPIGSLLGVLGFWHWLKQYFSFWQLWLLLALAYVSHGLLDALTSYGTMLYWPFSNQRVAWNAIAVVDPLVTLPLVVAIICSMLWKRRIYSCCALAWCLLYFCFGGWQHYQINQWLHNEHPTVTRAMAHPTLGNLLVWRVLYWQDNQIHVTGVRRSLAGHLQIYPGPAIKPNLPITQSLLQQLDLEQFSNFADGYVAVGKNGCVEDLRYAILPMNARGLWGVCLNNDPSKHVTLFRDTANSKMDKQIFWQMLVGSYRP